MLHGKVAIVTGASGTLGNAISLDLAGAGANLVLASRSEKLLDTVKQNVEKLGVKALVTVTDVTKMMDVEGMTAETIGKFGRIDILVNCHGVNKRIPTESYPLEEWQNIVDVNLRGTFMTCQTVGRYMIKQKGGKIINISSTAAESGYEWGYSAYAPSKAGVNALTKTLAVEWGKFGINVNAVSPYWIRTKLTRKFLERPEIMKTILSSIPLGRLGSPSDVVGVVNFLASPASDWITGQIIYVDGGYSAR